MLHDLDLVSVHEFGSKVDKAGPAGQSHRGAAPERWDFAVDAGVPPGCAIRDTVAGVAGRLHLEKRAFVTPEAVERVAPPTPAGDFVCENDVLASMAQDGKILIGPKTIVTSGASDLAARHDVLAQR
jgi:hypothetical protein